MDEIEHLEKALDHLEKAKSGYEDGTKEQSVADNAFTWTRKAVNVVQDRREED